MKLPPGVGEISTSELEALVAKGPVTGQYCLIDARPAKVAAASHIPTAISIPVNVFKEKGFDVKYLKAGCKCNLDGTYLIWAM